MTAYTPTAWVNNSTPALNATNLNHLTDELKAQALSQSISHTLPTWANLVSPAVSDAAPLNEMERVAKAVQVAVGSANYTVTTWAANWTPARNAANLGHLETCVQLNRAAIDNVGTVYNAPAPTGGNDVTSLTNFFATVPNGTVGNPSIIRFPAGTYQILTILSLTGRSNLIFESASAVLGGNTTFNWTTPLTQTNGFWFGNDSLRVWQFDSCTNITMRYLYIHGPAPMPASNADPAYGPYPGDGLKAWSEASVGGPNTPPGETEHMHGIAFYSCVNITVDRVKIDNCPGDGIDCGTNGEANDRVSYVKTSGLITGCDIRACHRQGISLTGTTGLTIQGCTFKRIGFQTIDLEPNSLASSNYTVTINGNTWLAWDGLLERSSVMAFAGSKYSVTYPTNECEDLAITNNTFTGIACLIRINTTQGGGLFPFANGAGTCRPQRVTITGNVSATAGPQQELNQIDTLNVSGNTFTPSSGTAIGLRLDTSYTITGSTFTVLQ